MSYERPTKKEKAKARDEAIETLRTHVKPGTTVHTICTHVSRSGMQRRIRCFLIEPDETHKERRVWPWDISHLVARALGYRRNDRDGGVIVGGCGMDMGFHLVHSLSYALHGMDTVGANAKEASRRGTPHEPKPDDYRAGYSLKHHWL